jgi:hypothetical protein
MCIIKGVFKVIEGENLDFLNIKENVYWTLQLKLGDMEKVQRYDE